MYVIALFTAVCSRLTSRVAQRAACAAAFGFGFEHCEANKR